VSAHETHCAPHARQVTCHPSSCTMALVLSYRRESHVQSLDMGRTGSTSASIFSFDHDTE
jgi:hypothetical protein